MKVSCDIGNWWNKSMWWFILIMQSFPAGLNTFLRRLSHCLVTLKMNGWQILNSWCELFILMIVN
ncbi:MAG: hypothetical protein ACD_34C00566G0002 [uncultured bacterium]|nr:MAG: hypothetical protein ACD_34C00566G0002 [uncultured bacterium]